MTYYGPEKKGLGLDAPRADEPGYYSGAAGGRPGSWSSWRRSPVASVISTLFWAGYAVFRLVELVTSTHLNGTDWLLFAFPSVMVLVSVQRLVSSMRSVRRRRRTF